MSSSPKKIFVHVRKKDCSITFSEVEEKNCKNIEYIRKEDAELDWTDIDNIRRIKRDLEMSIASENMSSIEFDAEVARRFNEQRRKRWKS